MGKLVSPICLHKVLLFSFDSAKSGVAVRAWNNVFCPVPHNILFRQATVVISFVK